MAEAVIAIKDFEMPFDCAECEVVRRRDYHKATFRAICGLSGVTVNSENWAFERHESCPLVEIPDHVG